MSKFVRKDALKLLSAIMAVCSTTHVEYMIQSANILSVLFAILMKEDVSKPIKSQNISIPALSKSEIASHYEQLLSIIWLMIQKLYGSSETKTQICLERLIFKLIENNLEKTKRIRSIFDTYLVAI